ncbi:type II secretion system F family protein [Actinomarinicola tropica]|uniref:Type II secretion system protein GspF domain-containing protein n=1 Tax=Actinomarinicola tropica TaxID=2789776 RepID=A0A5Q2RNK1_9ACTN|nr:type II secretion system F family protein [Actinomarinicola tropica]QGG96522.1 hypothetical protein GH723_16220 [Actinomarinicola tropica]
MSPGALAVLWAATALAASWSSAGRPAPEVGARIAALRTPLAAGRRRRSPAVAVGARLRRALGRTPDATADRAVGRLALCVAALGLVEPVLAVGALGVAGVARTLRRRRVARARRAALVDELPEVVDLLTLASSSGLSVPLAVATVGRHGVGEVAVALRRAHELTGRGVSLADAVAELPRQVGEEVRPLVRVLAGSLRDGTAIVPALERLASEVRTERRRAAEERARRLPVVLLFPLVVCVLPAFGLLTVVPLLVGALDGLPV